VERCVDGSWADEFWSAKCWKLEDHTLAAHYSPGVRHAHLADSASFVSEFFSSMCNVGERERFNEFHSSHSSARPRGVVEQD